MTTLNGRPNTALLVIDVQNGTMSQAHDRDSVIANIVTLIGKARAAGTGVVWVQHSSEEMPEGSENWQLVPELVRDAGEPLVPKSYGDAFEATDLETVLAAGGVGRLIVTGAQTDECIRSTLHGAVVRGYDATLVGDAHTTEDLSASWDPGMSLRTGRVLAGHSNPGGHMPTVMAHHNVTDRDSWLASARRDEFFGPLGVTNIRTFTDPQNPARVGILMDVPDLDALTAAMQTEAAAEAMSHDGVVAETLVILIEA